MLLQGSGVNQHSLIVQSNGYEILCPGGLKVDQTY